MVTNIDAMDFFRRFNQGEFPHQRLGQAFINNFSLDCCAEHAPQGFCLFNCELEPRCAKQIWEQWVEG